MRIWITGGAGFLGRRLTRSLKRGGNHIVSLSKRQSPEADESISIDLASQKEELKRLVQERGAPDVVVHCASREPGSYSLPEFVKSNVISTQLLIDAFRDAPPRQIIYTSSLEVYAKSARLPFVETHPTSSPAPYAATKRWAEQLLETFREAPVIILRLPSLYGAGQEDSFVDGLAKLAKNNDDIELFSRGEVIRDALHVTDVVTAIEACIERKPNEGFSIMNLGCGRPITSLEYAETLVEALGSNSKIVPVDQPASQFDCWADISEARRLIGFEPAELGESIRTYVDELV
ncbi:MAG TPA: NAD(P)-dependent oxidoreductase [Pyrinomonadaceae bacterium]|nr:NAD(P)-dependent oxidoreductase [Pyrinomonadaceae bacterium]